MIPYMIMWLVHHIEVLLKLIKYSLSITDSYILLRLQVSKHTTVDLL